MNSALKQWLETNLPEVVADLNGPGSVEQIEAVEKDVVVEFPQEFRSLYLTHDGQKDQGDATGPFYGLIFLTLDRMQNELKEWGKIVDAGDNECLSEFCKSHVNGMVREMYANKKWIPFAYDWGGNFLGLDYDPDKSGTRGQVINFGRDEDVKYVLAASFTEFIDWYVKELESGNFRIEPWENNERRSFNTKFPQTSHFLDSVKILFSERT